MTGVPRLVFRLMLDPRVPLRLKLVLPAAAVYVISPFGYAFGRIDDVLVIVVSLIIFLLLVPRDVVAEHLRGQGAGGSDGRARRPDGKVIEGSYRVVDDDEPRP
jgi:uncharacterized membrane protein YkvA (DUF1232 family)